MGTMNMKNVKRDNKVTIFQSLKKKKIVRGT